MTKSLLGIEVKKQSKKEILEQIKKYIGRERGKGLREKDFLHIVSLNPENFVILEENSKFKKVVREAQIKIVDGVGVQIALSGGIERVPGVDLAEEIIKMADKERLKVLLIGGKENLANELADCYSRKFPNLKLNGIQGIKNIQNPQKQEEEEIFSIVRRDRPHVILAAFGSPEQELWLASNASQFKGIVCMGVGGAFDFLSGHVQRAPKWMRASGLEWLYRLVRQPWRIKRQTRLVRFMWLVFREKFKI